VALVTSLLQEVYTKVKPRAIEMAARDAVKEHTVIVESQNAPSSKVIQEIARIVIFDVEGCLKNVSQTIQEWNDIADHRNRALQTPSSHRNCTPNSSRATEQAAIELDGDQVSGCLDAWAKEFLEYSLTPEQQCDPKYKLNSNGNLTSSQRSFCGAMLGKYAGHKSLAMAIWQKELPTQSLTRSELQQSAHISDITKVREDVVAIVEFFGSIGSKVSQRRDTEEWKKARRTTGTYRKSGVDEEE
jgi:hypothetical protein